MSRIMETVKEIIQAAAVAFDAPPESFVVTDDYGNEWTYVQERTCHAEYRTGGNEFGAFYCSLCNNYMDANDRYCPNCGAKVVE